MGMEYFGVYTGIKWKNEDLEIVLENPGSLEVSGKLCFVRANV